MDAEEDIPQTRRRRGAVMSDVGRLAGVSHQTVSRVINGSPHVRPETRQRVIAAMRELGYRPNSVARALVTGRSNTLGVVSFDTTLYGPASTLFGIERAAHEAGYFIIVASLKALDRASVAEAIERLRRHGVDGILVIAPQQEAADALLHAPDDIPLVAVEAGPEQARSRSSTVDQFAGAVAATRHLLDLGHETVWHVAGPDRLARVAQAARGLARDARAGRRRDPRRRWSATGAPRAGYELGRTLSREPAVTRDLRRQRPDGARGAARDARGRSRDPGRGQRRRVRRHPRGAVLHAAADDRAPGLQRGRQPRRAAAAAGRWRPASALPPGPAIAAGADRAREHGRASDEDASDVSVGSH